MVQWIQDADVSRAKEGMALTLASVLILRLRKIEPARSIKGGSCPLHVSQMDAKRNGQVVASA